MEEGEAQKEQKKNFLLQGVNRYLIHLQVCSRKKKKKKTKRKKKEKRKKKKEKRNLPLPFLSSFFISFFFF